MPPLCVMAKNIADREEEAMGIDEQIAASKVIATKYATTRCRWCGRSIPMGEPCLWLPQPHLPLTQRRCSHLSPQQCQTADWQAID